MYDGDSDLRGDEMSSSGEGQSRPVEADENTSLASRPVTSKKARVKAKAAEEIRDVLYVAAYLTLFLCAFAVYRALITSELVGSSLYLRFGVNVLAALVVAKAIVIGDKLRLSEQGKESALIVRTLRQSFVYSLFVCAFVVAEKIVEGFFHGERARHTLQNLLHLGWDEIAARTLVIFVALVPFFAFRDLARMTGRDRFDLIFHRQHRGSAT